MTDKTPDQTQNETIQQALETITTLALAERMADARKLFANLWPLISADIDYEQDPDNVNIFSGIALGYLNLDKRDEAERVAKIALMLAPTDLLAHAIASLVDRVSLARQFIHSHQGQKAIDLLEVIQGTAPAAADETAFYLQLVRHYEAGAQKARSLAPLGGRPTLFNLAIWGETYVDKFLRTSLPSLMAPGNVPALAADDTVIFDIYTTEADQARLAASPGICALSEIARIDYEVIPAEFIGFKKTPATQAPDRLYFSGSNYLSAVKAKALAADVTFVGTESLYSDRFFSESKTYLRDGYKAVLMSSLRARDDGLAAYLDMHDAVTDHAIALDAEHLVDYTAKNLNPQTRDMFIGSGDQPIGQDVVALYFKTANGFAGHSFQIYPALISHEIIPADLNFDGHTYDARLLAECSQGEDPRQIYKVIDNAAATLFMVDLDSASDGTERVFGAFPVTVEQCAKSAVTWCSRESDFPYFEWAFQQRFEFRCDSAGLPNSAVTEADAVAEFCERFAAAKPGQTRQIRYFRDGI
ncbi:MAG: hypothetical protein GKS00_00285 [Alphaproteobacteria bacterium]|nr:hypothetical protein [Alphaproteobacteria bacterium]